MVRQKRRPGTVETASIKQFVRGQLGCVCPDEVFTLIDVQPSPRPFEGVPGDCLVTIGDRLLLLFIETAHWQDVNRALEQLVRRGRELRDAGGFNRIRFVVATTEVQSAEALLRQRFSALSSADDRIHLHVVNPRSLPLSATQTGQGDVSP